MIIGLWCFWVVSVFSMLLVLNFGVFVIVILNVFSNFMIMLICGVSLLGIFLMLGWLLGLGLVIWCVLYDGIRFIWNCGC